MTNLARPPVYPSYDACSACAPGEPCVSCVEGMSGMFDIANPFSPDFFWRRVLRGGAKVIARGTLERLAPDYDFWIATGAIGVIGAVLVARGLSKKKR